MSSKKKKPLHENFNDYTIEEINRIKANICVKHRCPYLSKLKWTSKNKKSKAIGSLVCNYILMTDHMRGCMPDLCTHWKDKQPEDRKGSSINHLFDNSPDFEE